MVLNQTFELSLILDTDPFQRIFTTKASYLKEVELDGEYIDPSLAEKGITVVYRASKYKKRIRVLANAGMIVNDYSNTDKLIRKLDKCVSEYFNHCLTACNITPAWLIYSKRNQNGRSIDRTSYTQVHQGRW